MRVGYHDIKTEVMNRIRQNIWPPGANVRGEIALAEEFGLPAAEAFVFLSTLALMVVGIAAVFFILTRPLERLVLRVTGLVAPKLTFFAGSNLMRAKRRNTVIALMIVFSATLPTFLGTTAALTEANFDVNTRQRHGAPIDSRLGGGGYFS